MILTRSEYFSSLQWERGENADSAWDYSKRRSRRSAVLLVAFSRHAHAAAAGIGGITKLAQAVAIVI